MLYFSLALFGCANESDAVSKEDSLSLQKTNRITAVSKQIKKLRRAGLLDSLLNAPMTGVLSDDFIDTTLAEIAESDYRDVRLRLLEAMLNGGTVGYVADIMSEISENMATEYLTAMETQMEALDMLEYRDKDLIKINNLREIRLRFYDYTSTAPRGACGSDFNNDTISWYAGFCATTIAGAIAASSHFPLIAIPGTLVMAAGGTSMVIQLDRWAKDSAFRKWVASLRDQDGEQLTPIANSGVGPKLIVISGMTAGTVAICGLTPAGKFVCAAVGAAWGKIIDTVYAALPKNVTLYINGVRLGRF